MLTRLQPTGALPDTHLRELESAVLGRHQRARADDAQASRLDEQDRPARIDDPLARMVEDILVGGLHAEHGVDPLGVDVTEVRGQLVRVFADRQRAAGALRPSVERCDRERSLHLGDKFHERVDLVSQERTHACLRLWPDVASRLCQHALSFGGQRDGALPLVGTMPGLQKTEPDQLPDRAGDARLTDADGLDQLPDGERRPLQRRQDRHVRRLGVQTGIRSDPRRTGLQPFTETLQPAAEEGRPEFLDDIHRRDIHRGHLFQLYNKLYNMLHEGWFQQTRVLRSPKKRGHEAPFPW